MSTGALYIRRLGTMLGIAMPATALLLTSVELAGAHDRGPLNVAGGAVVLVYLWGAVTGTVVSLVHTALLRDIGNQRLLSIVLGTLFGLIGGALTPTFFTGLFEPAAIALGGFAGLVYGSIVAWQLDDSSKHQQKPS
jgi:hypothetical protein